MVFRCARSSFGTNVSVFSESVVPFNAASCFYPDILGFFWLCSIRPFIPQPMIVIQRRRICSIENNCYSVTARIARNHTRDLLTYTHSVAYPPGRRHFRGCNRTPVMCVHTHLSRRAGQVVPDVVVWPCLTGCSLTWG